MTEKDVYKNGVALLEEWGDVNYCEHSFKFKDEWLTDKEVVDLLNALNDENEELKDALNQRTDQCDKYYKENEQLKQFIQELTTKGTGRIDLANGYSYKINAILTDFKR